jgi:hypothetical protein
MKFEFTIEEVNLIMAALGRMPYEAVFQMIENIRQQAGSQLPKQEDGAIVPPPSAA